MSLNLIVLVDEMGAIESLDKLTFGINDDEVYVKNCESNAMWLIVPLSKIHGFVKAEFDKRVMGKQTCTDVSLLPLLLRLLLLSE